MIIALARRELKHRYEMRWSALFIEMLQGGVVEGVPPNLSRVPVPYRRVQERDLVPRGR